MGYNGHGSLEHACAACEVLGTNKIDGVAKPGKVWYPTSPKGKARPEAGQHFFRGKIHKDKKKGSNLFRYDSTAFKKPKREGGFKRASTHLFFNKMEKFLKDVPNQICIDSMHTCDLNVGRRLISQAILGMVPGGKSKQNLKMVIRDDAQEIHKVLTQGKANKGVWQRGRLVSRIPREIAAIGKWKGCEIRVFTQYEFDIILSFTGVKAPKKSKSEKVVIKKTKIAAGEGRRYNFDGDGLDDKRLKFLYSYIAGHAILDTPELVEDDESINLAQNLWEMCIRLGEELWGNNFAQITCHQLRHLPSQVKYHRQTLTAMGCWRFESLYSILGDMIHHGHHGLIQFRKRYLEKLDVKGSQELKEMKDISIDTWASVGTWYSEDGKGEIWHIEREGTNANNQELVLVKHYKGAIPTIPNIESEEYNVFTNFGQLLGKWKVKEDECVHKWILKDAFLASMKAKYAHKGKYFSKFTPALLFTVKGFCFSQPIHHLR